MTTAFPIALLPAEARLAHAEEPHLRERPRREPRRGGRAHGARRPLLRSPGPRRRRLPDVLRLGQRSPEQLRARLERRRALRRSRDPVPFGVLGDDAQARRPVRRPDHAQRPPGPQRGERLSPALRSLSAVREPNHRETPHELDRKTIAEIVAGLRRRRVPAEAGRLRRLRGDGEPLPPRRSVLDAAREPPRRTSTAATSPSRMRFAVEVLQAIRERVGPDFVVGIRMTGDEMLEGGLDREAAQEIAGRLDAARASRLLQRRRRELRDVRHRGGDRARHELPARPVRGSRGLDQGGGRRAGDRDRPHQRPGGRRARAERRTGGSVRHDPGPHRRSGPAREGSRGPPRRHPPLHRLQLGLHRPHLHRTRRHLRAERRRRTGARMVGASAGGAAAQGGRRRRRSGGARVRPGRAAVAGTPSCSSRRTGSSAARR